MILKWLTLFVLIFSTQLSASGVSSLSQHIISARRASFDAKLFELEGKWVVLLSNNTVLVFHEEEQIRLQDFLKGFENDIPPYYLSENPKFFNPYQLIFEEAEESFTLMASLGAQDIWVLGYGDHKLYHLEEIDPLSIVLRLIGIEDAPSSRWEIHTEKTNFHVGDFFVVANIWAYTQQEQIMAGYLAFRFDTEAEALAWQGSDSGYWVSPESNRTCFKSLLLKHIWYK